ncbi:Tyrosine recombinase XerC [Providencia stuartii]|nr:Tyrosine recombinase XerC [Providencia stuartii]
MDRAPITPQPQGLMIQVEAFLRYLQIERRLSPVTITNYRRQLTVVVEMLNEMNVSEWRQLDATKARNVAAKSRRKGLQSCQYGITFIGIAEFL